MAVAEGEDLEWISYSVVAILKSPTWAAPIMQFVDKYCGIFDDVDENKLEYTPIHNEFKTLIDDLLTAHLSELSVTAEQFTRFCQQGLSGSSQLHRNLVEQLLSVDDFLVFKAMMVKRNADLQKEALMSSSCGLPPQQTDEEREAERLEHERRVVEAELAEAERRCVEAELQLAIALSLQLKMRLRVIEALNEAMDMLGTIDQQAAIAALEGSGAPLSELEQVGAAIASAGAAIPHEVAMQPLQDAGFGGGGLGSGVPMSDADCMALETQRTESALQRDQARMQRTQAPQQPQGPTAEERQARAEHLRRQREMLVAKKQKERENELATFTQTQGPTVAARAAEKACERTNSGIVGGPRSPQGDEAGRKLAEELSGIGQPPPAAPLPDPQAAALEMRKALTRQLRHTLSQ